MHVMRINIHTALKGAPQTIVFDSDVFLDVTLIADWKAIKMYKRIIIFLSHLNYPLIFRVASSSFLKLLAFVGSRSCCGFWLE